MGFIGGFGFLHSAEMTVDFQWKTNVFILIFTGSAFRQHYIFGEIKMSDITMEACRQGRGPFHTDQNGITKCTQCGKGVSKILMHNCQVVKKRLDAINRDFKMMDNAKTSVIKKLWYRLFPNDLDMQKYYENEWKSGKVE